jgi:aspartate ammonia-lyase
MQHTMLHVYCDGKMLQTIMVLGVDNFIKLSQRVTDKNLNFLPQMFHQLLTDINILMNCCKPFQALKEHNK